MVRRLLLLAAFVALALLPGSSSVAQVDECSRDGGVPSPASSNATVVVYRPTYATHRTTLSLRGAGAVVDGSLRYDVVAPAGATSVNIKGDSFLASYTPPVVGRYSVTATFSEMTCANGDRSTYANVTTPPSQFEALPGERPTVSFRTARRPTRPNSPGDATLLGFLDCPAPSRAAHDDADLAIYYETGNKKPTRNSRHLRLHQGGGCDGLKNVGRRERRTKTYSLALRRSLVTVQALAPTRLRILVEITYAGKLLGHSYGTFAPSRTGESLTRR